MTDILVFLGYLACGFWGVAVPAYFIVKARTVRKRQRAIDIRDTQEASS